MGGLVVKQPLMRSATITKASERAVAEQTRAVVFLSTPHTGAGVASFVGALGPLLRQTESLKGLAAHDAHLRDQAEWYL
jgi:hypothetical protein